MLKLMFWFFLMSACGQVSPSHLEGLEKDPPVYVISGGFTSCESLWDDPTATDVFAKARAVMSGDRPAWIATCFVTSGDSLRIRTDLDPEVLDIKRLDLAAFVKARMNLAGPTSRLILIGHSWGGWLALSIALDLGAAYPLSYLATIDPVSPKLCGPGYFLRGFFEPAGLRPCDQGPADLTATLAAIATEATRWEHFYQDRFHFLHAPPLAAAHRNHHVRFDLARFEAWKAHVMIAANDEVWMTIKQSLARKI